MLKVRSWINPNAPPRAPQISTLAASPPTTPPTSARQHDGLATRTREHTTPAAANPLLTKALRAALPPLASNASVQEITEHMSQLSPDRKKRGLKKSASPQLLSAKDLTPQQRTDFERSLEDRFRDPNHPQADAALDIWLSVQHARLRTHSAKQKNSYRKVQFTDRIAPALMLPLFIPFSIRDYATERKAYYSSSSREEYQPALHNFLRIIGDTSVPLAIRNKVEEKLAYHTFKEGTITPAHVERLQPTLANEKVSAVFAAEILAELGGPPLDDHTKEMLALAKELRAQKLTLSQEISKWQKISKQPAIQNTKPFDKDPQAPIFARVLGCKLKLMKESGQTDPVVLKQGSEIIQAIAKNETLRSEVFGIATTALGACGDNLAEGFSKIVLHVKKHKLIEAVKNNEISPTQFNDAVHRNFRLSVVEEEVHRIIAERTHFEEVETMLHAKIELAKMIELPMGLPSKMSHQGCSKLKKGKFKGDPEDDFQNIAKTVENRENDGSFLRKFMTEDPDWLPAMHILHENNPEYKRIWKEYQDNPIMEELPPQNYEQSPEATLDYVCRMNAVGAKKDSAHLELLLNLGCAKPPPEDQSESPAPATQASAPNSGRVRGVTSSIRHLFTHRPASGSSAP